MFTEKQKENEKKAAKKVASVDNAIAKAADNYRNVVEKRRLADIEKLKQKPLAQRAIEQLKRNEELAQKGAEKKPAKKPAKIMTDKEDLQSRAIELLENSYFRSSIETLKKQLYKDMIDLSDSKTIEAKNKLQGILKLENIINRDSSYSNRKEIGKKRSENINI